MPKVVNREELLAQLESVEPGLSPREIIEQSSCFVFRNGKVITFNDEMAMRSPCILDIEGAVTAGPLLAVLRKLPEDTLEYEIVDGELIVSGKRRKCGFRLEAQITLPVDKVEKPDKWASLPEEFSEAVNMVQFHAGHDEEKWKLTCVNLDPEFMESCNNVQAIRVRIKTGLKTKALAKCSALRHIVPLGMTELSETPSWIHFRNSKGLIVSVRRYVEEFDDITGFYTIEGGKPITLPKGLGETVEKASIFSSESTEQNLLSVELRSGKMRVKGTGATGWYQEVKQLTYDGPDLAFLISPDLLEQITTKYNEAEVTEGRLKVEGGKWTFVTCLTLVGEDKHDDPPPEEPKKSRKKKEKNEE